MTDDSYRLSPFRRAVLAGFFSGALLFVIGELGWLLGRNWDPQLGGPFAMIAAVGGAIIVAISVIVSMASVRRQADDAALVEPRLFVEPSRRSAPRQSSIKRTSLGAVSRAWAALRKGGSWIAASAQRVLDAAAKKGKRQPQSPAKSPGHRRKTSGRKPPLGSRGKRPAYRDVRRWETRGRRRERRARQEDAPVRTDETPVLLKQ